MSTFSSGLLISTFYWDVNTPIFTHKKNAKKQTCVLLLLPKTTNFEAYFLSWEK